MSTTTIERTPETTPRLLLRDREAAELMSISREKAYLMIRSGEMPGIVRIGRSVRIHRPTLVRWLEERASETQKGSAA